MNWRRLNNVLHRDIGYLAVGLSVVYGVSGVAVNHVRDWNPSYRVQKTMLTIAPIRATDRAEIIREARQKLGVTGLFVLKGKTGITGRGAWLTGAGVLLPVAYWVFHLYLE